MAEGVKMSLTGVLGALLIIAMLVMGVWFGCKGEKEGGGRSQYEEPIDRAEEAADQAEEAQRETLEQIENIEQ